MIIGVPTEIAADEHRVALTPAGAQRTWRRMATSCSFKPAPDWATRSPMSNTSSKELASFPTPASVFAQSELVLGVKGPQLQEVALLSERHTVFSYLHLAADLKLTKSLQDTGATYVAYESVEDADGRLPLLAPMSEVAGKLAMQVGAFFLERPLGGRGVLLGGVPGVGAATVMIIGGGIVGRNAASIALGMQAKVIVLDRSLTRLQELDVAFGGRLSTVHASALAIEQLLPHADLVIGGVLIRGARAPYVITSTQLATMKRRAVLVDVSMTRAAVLKPHIRARTPIPCMSWRASSITA